MNIPDIFKIPPIRPIALWLPLLLAFSVTAPKAQAGSWYFETQTGATQFTDTNNLFNSGTQGSSDLGIGFSLGIFYSPFQPSSGFEFQMGLQHEVLSASQGTSYMGIQAPFGVVRVQFLSSYLSAGLSPFVWRRNSGSPGIDSFSLASGTLAYLAEAGILYSATPKFSLGGAVSTDWFSSSLGLSKPALALTFVMRFYFGFSSEGGTGGNSHVPLEWSGWRYIGK